ncbi:LysM peptidoglycan-binding domain-containing protein [bacterium]|nr:LysM peptidoglycan-binding domain-containing protein [bacterium]
MTRENKLSIVIAFGLLIFVGMLVADHFSIASYREVADLGSNVSPPPLVPTGPLLDGPPPPEQEENTQGVSGDVIHIVLQGETLHSICKDYYEDSGLASGVATWNNLKNPNEIEKGSRISLPNRSSLVAIGIPFIVETETVPAPTPRSHSTKMGTYTVKAGDTLSEIAQKVMGTTKKTQLLIDLNKDVMPNPDFIRPGMILKFPLQP